jgi:exo-beta-1,3-glucanase (GH17 family)
MIKLVLISIFLFLSTLMFTSFILLKNQKTNKKPLLKPKTAAQILGDSNYLAVCYGGYRTNTRDVQPTIEELKEDLMILSAMGIKLLRTYNVHFDETKNLLQAISELKKQNPSFEMYVMLGIWIDCKNAFSHLPQIHNEESNRNEIEINEAIRLTNQYPDIVIVLSVGNEAMVKWASNYYVEPNIILKWVEYLQEQKQRNALNKNIWITSSDNFASWGGGDSIYHTTTLTQLYKAVDYVSIHTYPMHDTHYNPVFWGTMKHDNKHTQEEKIDSIMIRSVQYAKQQYQNVYYYMQSIGINKPIHIGETGWASQSESLYGSNGSRACDELKAAKYYHLIREWTNHAKITCFYFEAFDENWKDKDRPMGSENHFGLFTINGKAKYALWNYVDKGLFIGLKRNGNFISKTFNGNKVELLKTVEIPDNKNNKN